MTQTQHPSEKAGVENFDAHTCVMTKFGWLKADDTGEEFFGAVLSFGIDPVPLSPRWVWETVPLVVQAAALQPPPQGDEADYAKIGREFVGYIGTLTGDGPGGDPRLKGWTPAENYSEIISDLLGMLDDAAPSQGGAVANGNYKPALSKCVEALEKDRRFLQRLVNDGRFFFNAQRIIASKRIAHIEAALSAAREAGGGE